MAAFFVLAVMQWLHWSSYPGATLTELLQVSACGCVFLLGLAAFQRPSHVRAIGLFFWALTGALAVEALWQYSLSPTLIYGYRDASYGTPMGPFVYHNHYAGFMDLLLPLAWAAALRTDSSPDAAWVGQLRRSIVPALGVVSVLAAASRGGVVTLGIEAAVALWIYRRSLDRRRVVLLGTLAVTFAAGMTIAASNSSVVRRFAQLTRHDASALDRVKVGDSALHMFAERPWFGFGLNSFASVYPRFQTFDSGLEWDSAHDEYVQILAEMGLGGGLCVAAFAILLLVAGLRLRSRPASNARNVRLAAFIGAIGFLFHSFGDFEFHAMANSLLFFVLVALVAAEPQAPTRIRRHSRSAVSEGPVRA